MEQVIGKKSKPIIILKSLILSYIVTGILLVLLAFLLFKFELDEGKVSVGIIAVYLLSSFLGGFFAGKSSGSRKFLWGLLVGVAYFLLLTLISLTVRQTIQTPAAQMMTTFLLCLGGGMLGGMLS